MKRIIYLSLTIVLGFLLQFFVHAGIEILYIGLLVRDYATFGFGLSWQSWIAIHHVMSILLVLMGVWGGYRLGVWWWRVVYVEHRHWSRKA